MSNFVVDVEADGPVPGLYSMVSIGAVLLDNDLETTFYGQLKPISQDWVPEALAISGHSRLETLDFPEPAVTMELFAEWVEKHSKGRPIFWADNNGFDFAMVNYYFHAYLGKNPFGWSSQNINSLYKGIQNNMYAGFGHLRKTKHTHHPVDDAKGNAEALLAMRADGLKIKID